MSALPSTSEYFGDVRTNIALAWLVPVMLKRLNVGDLQCCYLRLHEFMSDPKRWEWRLLLSGKIPRSNSPARKMPKFPIFSSDSLSQRVRKRYVLSSSLTKKIILFIHGALEEGDEGCNGPGGKLLRLRQTQKICSGREPWSSGYGRFRRYAPNEWQHSILAWLLGQSVCSSPSTKELHDSNIIFKKYEK